MEGIVGRILTNLGFKVQCRKLSEEFLSLRFNEQLTIVEDDLQSIDWASETVLIGHSYGAYILLHTLATMTLFPGRVLLISPVLGQAVSGNFQYGMLPPRARMLLKMAKHGTFPIPRYLEIHIGANDNSCDPNLAREFASLIATSNIHIIPGTGHNLSEAYLETVLNTFLYHE
ncbi:MAG: alpha/beta hydrolase [Desulfobacterales bacterium]|nr:alpha/beta hydrolase [Desulfobacterales bacterium]